MAEKNALIAALQDGKISLQGQFISGSNYTFLVNVVTDELKFTAVYKPSRGEQPLWDFPAGTLCKREVAAFVLSDLLGWDLVPPTIYRRKGNPLGAGSLQVYVRHDSNYHYFKFSDADRQRLRPVVLFDCLINNADRKGSHILKGEDGHFWLIDHGICFHVEDKLRTVIWDFAGEPIPAPLLDDLRQMIAREETEQWVSQKMGNLLRKSEIRALARRAAGLVESGHFPVPAGTRRSYPWPPV